MPGKRCATFRDQRKAHRPHLARHRRHVFCGVYSVARAIVRSRKSRRTFKDGVAVIHSRQQFFAPIELAVSPPPVAMRSRRGSPFTSTRARPKKAAAPVVKAPRLPILDAPRRDYSTEEAYAFCRALLRSRQENVPVASSMLPEALRPHVLAVYAFARAADDFADEPAYEGKRHFALDQWESELFRTFHGEADHPIFIALRDTIERRDLPITPFTELLTGLRLDLHPAPYITFEELRTYCRHRSETLGQIMLLLFGYREPALLRYAAELCTGLQLVSFLQDLGHDLSRGRIYIPLEDLRHFGISDEELQAHLGPKGAAQDAIVPSPAWRDLLHYQSARARAMLLRGRPLLEAVGEDLGLELKLTYHSGLAMLDKIDSVGAGLLQRAQRPTLGRADRALVLGKAMGSRFPRLQHLASFSRWISRRGDWNDL
jgi:squalene synthase HpnC